MKRLLAYVQVLSASAVICSASAATTYKWKYRDGVGTSPESMASWSDSENWTSGVASGSDAYADFYTNTPDNVGTRYVRMPDSLSLHSLRGYRTTVNNVMSGHRLVFVGGTLQPAVNSANGLIYAQLFADVQNPNNSYVQDLAMCGTFDLDHRLTVSGYTYEHRTDLYAKGTSSVRSNFTTTNEVYTGGDANFRIFGPVTTREAQTATWRRTQGSAILVRTAADAHPITSGTTVRGTGIPSGAFVKRIFSNSVIEISAQATADAEDAVTFDAFAPSLHHRIKTYIRAGAKSYDDISAYKSSEGDSVRLEFDVLKPNTLASECPIALGATISGWLPGTIVLHDAQYGYMLPIGLYTAHIEFGEAADEGFSKVRFYCRSASSSARLTVTNGISATIGCISNFVGTVAKDGAGTLVAGVRPTSSGSLSVDEGIMELVSDVDATIASVSIASGATLKLPAGMLSVSSFSFEEGAAVEGPGVLAVPVGTSLSGLLLRGGARVRFVGGASTRLNLVRPVPGVPGDPAFWVDVTATNSMTLDAVGGFVRRLDDVRGGANRVFATNAAASVRGPAVVTQNGEYHHLKFTRNANDGGLPENTDALVWNVPVTGIRAVFKVLDCIDGGGQFLGSTQRLKVSGKDGDFMRPAQWVYNNAIVINRTDLSANVRNGECYMNGKKRLFTEGYAYKGGGGGKSVPQLAEMHPIGNGARADCFGFTYGGGRNGEENLCECIVYTNSLTEAERAQVREYLMRKWLGTELDMPIVPDGAPQSFDVTGSGGIDVGAGESLALGEVSGDGTFVKTGEGDLELAEYAHPEGAIHVMGGNMKVRSPVAGEALIPSGAWWHIDASATNLMTLTSVDDELRVKKWTDSGEGDYVLIKPSSSANTNPFPKLKLNALGGRPVVDFGPFMLKTAYNNLPSLRLTYRQERGVYKKGLRTAVTVMGSAQGGCSIVGETDSTSIGYNNGYGVQRGGSYGASPSDPIIINSYSDHPSYLEPNAVRVRTNGVSVVGTSTGLSGGYDLVTFAAYDSFGTGALAMNHYCQYAGGQEVAESFYYERGLSTESIEGLEAYLRKKWFGVDTPGYRPATAASLTVDAGASFEVVGGESMKVALLSGGGSVSGSLVLADNGVLEVPVAADGSVGTLSVSGDVDLSSGGVVRLTGFQRALRGGEYVLVRAGTISAGSGEWTVTGTALRSGCEYSVRVEAGSVVLVVRPLGAVLIVL